MKTAFLFLIIICSAYLNAQNIEPKFEQDGEMVKATYFHDNGVIAQTGHMLKNKLHGDWLMFNNEGVKIAQGKYVNGMRHGIWFFWESDIVNQVNFIDNKIAAVKALDATDGVVVN